MRRVGIVIGHLTIGGAERQVYELAVGLTKTCAYEPVVICYSNFRNPFGSKLEKEGVKVVYLNSSQNYLSKLAWIRKQLIENDCQIAYAFLPQTNVYCWLACMSTGIAFIASVRGIPHLNLLFGLGLNAAFAGSDIIIANSESGKKWAVKKHKADPKKIVTIVNAVRHINFDPSARKILRIELGIEPHEIVIGLVSNIKEAKCPDFMLEIASDFLKVAKDIHFIWVGDGSLYTDILRRYHALPSTIQSKIHFVGAKENIGDWFSVFNIFMLISEGEGLPNALMEAMSLGLPCICSDVPGIVDVINNYQTGILVPNNKEGWISSLSNLVQNKELSRFVGENAKNEMLKYSPQMLVANTTAIFNEILSKNNRSKRIIKLLA